MLHFNGEQKQHIHSKIYASVNQGYFIKYIRIELSGVYKWINLK